MFDSQPDRVNCHLPHRDVSAKFWQVIFFFFFRIIFLRYFFFICENKWEKNVGRWKNKRSKIILKKTFFSHLPKLFFTCFTERKKKKINHLGKVFFPPGKTFWFFFSSFFCRWNKKRLSWQNPFCHSCRNLDQFKKEG